jgi:hypothetical protein
VTGAPLNPALPANVAFRTGAATQALAVVAVGGTQTVNWPFNITRQAVKVHAFLGTDGVNPGIAPIPGASIWLYDTYANAVLAGAAGRIGTGTTSTAGEVIFRFLRTADIGPGGGTDNIVFAAMNTLPDANHVLNGETVIEIKYNAKDSLTMAPDTFDALNGRIVVKVHAHEIDFDTLVGWTYEMRAARDSIGGGSSTFTNFTNINGDLIFDIDIATINSIRPGLLGVQTFPDTLWFKLAAFQIGAGGHGFIQTPEVGRAQAMGSFFRIIWNGTVSIGDTVFAGISKVRYTDSDVVLNLHREQDDSTGVTPLYSSGDSRADDNLMNVQLYRINANGTRTSVGAATAPAAGTGTVTYLNIPTQLNYEARARSTHGGYFVLNDTVVAAVLDGADQVVTVAPLKGTAGNSTFAYKSKTNLVSGTIRARDGTPADATAADRISVRIQAGPGNIQGVKDTTVVTNAAGFYTTLGNLVEGPYTITVTPNTKWAFEKTLTTVGIAPSPLSATDVAFTSGSANNADAVSGARDLQGYADNKVANFLAVRTDTKIQGVVINDRDSDFNTIDPDEALAGVTIELWQDVDSSSVAAVTPTPNAADVQVGTTTTDGFGAYEFTGLKEGYYIVRAISPSNATVLRALTATGATTASVHVTTRAAAGAACVVAPCTLNQNLTRNVGNKAPPAQLDELPRWNYLTGLAAADAGGLGAGPNFTNGATTTTPTHFVHLFRTGSATGKVLVNGTLLAVPGARVTITRCQTAASAPSPPVPGACTAKHGVPSPHIMNYDTDATGTFMFTGLLEGVYQVDVAPATAGYTTINAPISAGPIYSYLLTIQGNNDVETTPNFLIS